MIAALKEVVIPHLRSIGFVGAFPHFRRSGERSIDLLTFQFNRWGGSFVVEAASCSAGGVTLSWGKRVPANKVTAHCIGKRLRLGSSPPAKTDHWFEFEDATYGERIFAMVAEQVLDTLPQAENYWRSLQNVA